MSSDNFQIQQDTVFIKSYHFTFPEQHFGPYQTYIVEPNEKIANS